MARHTVRALTASERSRYQLVLLAATDMAPYFARALFAIVPVIDVAAGVVTVDPPDGLLDPE